MKQEHIKIIDFILTELIEKDEFDGDDSASLAYKYSNLTGIKQSDKEWETIFRICVNNKLIIKFDTGYMYSITDYAVELLSKYNNSYLKYAEAQELIIERQNKKDNYDFHFSKWRSKTFMVVFIFGIFGGAYSGYDLIIKLIDHTRKDKTELNKQENTKITEDIHTLPSSHKNQDSLYNDKIQPNIYIDTLKIQ